jgi:hypothetical protein
MAQLIVGLTPTLARALARGERTKDTTRLRDLTTSGRLELVPQRSRSLDEEEPTEDPANPEPVVWFSAETDDADDLSTQLLRIPGVTAAYVTPPQGPP